jgi:predicted acylesterase/phospholipase RssA
MIGWTDDARSPGVRNLLVRIGSLVGRPGLASYVSLRAGDTTELREWALAFPNDLLAASILLAAGARHNEGDRSDTRPAGKHSPRRLQICFQGAGARLAQLIGAAAGLKKAEGDSRVAITRLTGASAGAIAAVLLAQRVDFDQFRTKLTARNGRFQRLYSKSIGKGLKIVRPILFGETLADESRLKQLVAALLETADIDPALRIGDLRTPTLLILGNIQDKTVERAPDDMSVIDALEISVSVPVFSHLPRGASTSDHYIDGAILDNLPAEKLLEDTTFGEVVAVSFAKLQSKARYEGHPRGTLRYLDDVWDSIHTTKAWISKALVGEEHAFELTPCIGATEFDRFLNPGMASCYARSHDEVLERLDKLLRSPVHYQGGSGAQKEFAGAREKLSRIEREAKALRDRITSRPIVGRRLEQIIYMRDLTTGSRDQVQFIQEIENEIEEPLFGHYFSMNYPSEDFGRNVAIGVEDSKGEPVPSMSVPIAYGDDRGMLVLFSRPLLKGEWYKVSKDEWIKDYMSALKLQGEDTASVYGLPPYPNSIRFAAITLYVPEKYDELDIADDLGRADFVAAPTRSSDRYIRLAEMIAYRRESLGVGDIQGIALRIRKKFI